MVTIYGARSQAEAMIASINRRHARITGRADDGRTYAAGDTELLDWVQATAGYGFGEAYHRFVHPCRLPNATTRGLRWRRLPVFTGRSGHPRPKPNGRRSSTP
jgi:uncharacterized protein (DUF2236 family)